MVSAQELFFVAAYGAATAILFYGHMPFWKAALLGLSVIVIAFLIKYT